MCSGRARLRVCSSWTAPQYACQGSVGVDCTHPLVCMTFLDRPQWSGLTCSTTGRGAAHCRYMGKSADEDKATVLTREQASPWPSEVLLQGAWSAPGRLQSACMNSRGATVSCVPGALSASPKHEKRPCRDCRGRPFCAHDRLDRFCKACGGDAFCVHGAPVCEHGRQAYGCSDCKGTGFNVVDRFKHTYCKERSGNRQYIV